MGIILGVNTVNENLVFGFDTNYGIADNATATRFYPGETTENLIYDMGGTVTSAYPEVVYQCTATETNVTDATAPGGKYSRFTGNSTSSNQQLYSRFSSYSIDVRGDSVNYSVYLKGTGTCHLTIYDNQSGYGTSSTITLTSDWVRYNYTRTVSASATGYWVAVRGVLNTTDVYVAGQQATRNTHATPYVEDNRSATQSLIDLKKETNINVGSISFDSTGHPDFDGTDDFLVSSDSILVDGDQSWETVFMPTGNADSPAGIITNHKFNSSPPSNFGINYISDNKLGASIGYTDGTREYASKTTTNAVWVNGNNVAVHAVLTYDAGNNRIIWYINGELDATHNLSKTPAFSSVQMCSGRWDAAYPDYYFGGKIYVAKVYDKLLTDAEVLQNYKAYKNRFDI